MEVVGSRMRQPCVGGVEGAGCFKDKTICFARHRAEMAELARIKAAGIDAIIVPGGFAPDYMRRNQASLP